MISTSDFANSLGLLIIVPAARVLFEDWIPTCLSEDGPIPQQFCGMRAWHRETIHCVCTLAIHAVSIFLYWPLWSCYLYKLRSWFFPLSKLRGRGSFCWKVRIPNCSPWLQCNYPMRCHINQLLRECVSVYPQNIPMMVGLPSPIWSICWC